MAAVAQTPIGAREALEGMSSPPEAARADGRSPRCEAFVMTGDKILNLNPNVSPSYAKLAKEQLPPRTAVAETPRRGMSPSEFPSVRRSRIPASTSSASSRRQLFGSGSREGSSEKASTPPTEPGPSLADELAQACWSQQSPVEDVECHDSASAIPHRVCVDSAMQTSQCSSQPMLHKRTNSSDTFVINAESPTKESCVTMNGVGSSSHALPTPSISGHASPACIRGVSRGSGSVCSRDDQHRNAGLLATRLFCLNGYTRAQVAHHLDLDSEFACLVCEHYMQLFQFQSKRIDAALREFLARVELVGETAQRERLLQHFSRRYHEGNPALLGGFDEVHALTCALLLLNSDLHGPNCGKKMSKRDFVNNLGCTGGIYDAALLKNLYDAIKHKAIALERDKAEEKSLGDASSIRSKSTVTMRLAEVDPESQVEYKSGWVMRKCVYDSDGNKTPIGRRGWRMWYVRLRGLALYFDRDEHVKRRSKWETFSNSILLFHSIAGAATDYKKKQHCFRVRTANLGEFLFQTSSANEVSSWVDAINFVCACFSARALPPPAGSAMSFSRARLPALPSTASLPEQLRNHESSACELREQLAEVQSTAPPLTARGRAVHEFFFKERFLTKEIERYDAYAQILRQRVGPTMLAKLGGGSSDSTSGVHSKSDIGDDADKLSYKEAVSHS